jgi:hypothetical protein
LLSFLLCRKDQTKDPATTCYPMSSVRLFMAARSATSTAAAASFFMFGIRWL